MCKVCRSALCAPQEGQEHVAIVNDSTYLVSLSFFRKHMHSFCRAFCRADYFQLLTLCMDMLASSLYVRMYVLSMPDAYASSIRPRLLSADSRHFPRKSSSRWRSPCTYSKYRFFRTSTRLRQRWRCMLERRRRVTQRRAGAISDGLGTFRSTPIGEATFRRESSSLSCSTQ